MLYRKGDVDAWVNEGRVEIVRADDERLKDTEHVTVVPAQETKG